MTNDRFDPNTLSAAELSDALRAWLRARREVDEVLAAAMAYEIAALVARNAASMADAVALIDVWTAEMKEQIRVFGVGAEHP
jgi:hypothetical protein